MKCEGIRRDQVGSLFCSPHTGRKFASSQEYRGLGQQTVELYLKNGRSTGLWILLINDCNTLPKDVIRNATPTIWNSSDTIQGEFSMPQFREPHWDKKTGRHPDGSIHVIE
jgi:hypothetical protein